MIRVRAKLVPGQRKQLRFACIVTAGLKCGYGLRPYRGFICRIEGYSEQLGLQFAQRACSCNHQCRPSCNNMSGSIDNERAKLIGESGMCEFAVFARDAPGKVMRPLLLKRREQGRRQRSQIVRSPANEVAPEKGERLLCNEEMAEFGASRRYPCRYHRKLRDQAAAGVA